MDDQKRKIIEDLSYIAAQKRTVNLISNFRGIPINLSASVIRYSPSTQKVRLCIHHRQIVSIKTADQILVQSDLFPEMVIANIDQIDFRSKIISLRNLGYVSGSMGNRKNIRVQPESPLIAEINSDHGFNLLGEIIDISLEGLSIQLDQDSLPKDDLFIPQSSVKIQLGLPGSGNDSIHDMTIQAEVAYIKESQQTCRIGLLTFPGEYDQQVMRRYIFDRQTAILNEIKHINNALLQNIDF